MRFCFIRRRRLCRASSAPGLTITGSSLPENSPQGTVIGTFSYPNTTAPTGKTLSVIHPAGTLQLVGDQLQAGPTPVDYEATPTIDYELSYTDGGVPYIFTRSISVVNVLAPANTGAPVITGTARVGQILTASNGTWSGVPAGYSYQWQRSADGATGWAAISGATAQTCTLVAADDLQYLRCAVTASNVEGAGAPAYSAATAQVRYAAPTAAGGLSDRSYVQGSGNQTVNAAPDFTNAVGGTWSVAGGGASISGAGVVTIPTTTLQAGTVVTVTYTNSGGAASSAFQLTVTSAPTAPSAMAAPTFTGVTTSGFTVVRAAAPADGGSAITSYDLRWSADAGATWTTMTGIGASQAITGRAAGTAHLAQTRAVNAVGAGAWGASGTVTTAAGDTTAPVVTASSYDSGTSALSMSVTEADSLPCTLYWAAVATGSTPSAAQVEAGTGGGILQAGTASLGSGANSFTISLTNTSIKELHFVVKDGSGNSTGTPAAGSHTIITGITVAAAGIAALGYATATGTGATYTVPLTGLTGWDGGAGGAAAAGDLAVVLSGYADNSDLSCGVSDSGWTEVEDLYADDTRDAQVGIDWKVLTAGDIAAGVVNVLGANNAAKGGASIIIVFRGQSGSPYKGKAVAATGIDGDAIDPPAYTTTVANSYVLCLGGSTRAPNSGTEGTAGSGATEFATIFCNGSTRAFLAVASFSKGNVAGTAIDQGARTGTPANTGDSWAAQTIEVA